VFTVNVAVDEPAATVTLPGAVAAPLLLDSVTTTPPVGATPVNVTVPCELTPPTTLLGLNATELTLGFTVRFAFCVAPPNEAEMVTGVELETTLVFTGKVVLVVFAATVTVGETLAAGLLLDRLTIRPPVGAAPFNVTVPVDVTPPATVVGLRLIEDKDGGLIVSVACCVPPP